MPAKKKISTADLKKLFKEAYKLDPMKPVPKDVSARMDALLQNLLLQKRLHKRKLLSRVDAVDAVGVVAAQVALS
jgi:hypothetical protein